MSTSELCGECGAPAGDNSVRCRCGKLIDCKCWEDHRKRHCDTCRDTGRVEVDGAIRLCPENCAHALRAAALNARIEGIAGGVATMLGDELGLKPLGPPPVTRACPDPTPHEPHLAPNVFGDEPRRFCPGVK